MRKQLWAILLLAAAATAHADSVPITGTSFVSETAMNFQITGPGINLFSPSPDGILNLGTGGCPQGRPCELSMFIPGVSTFTSGNSSYFGLFNGQQAFIFGGLTFTASIFAPVLADGQFQVMTIPVSFVGQLDVFLWSRMGPLNELGSFSLSGTGTLDAFAIGFGGVDYFRAGTFAFSGVAEPTPEPASLVLFASGLAGMGALVLQRRRRIH